MTKRVVFLSLPMSGYSEYYVKQNIRRAKEAYLAITKMDISQVAFVDNFGCVSPFDPETSKTANRIWCLGNALKQLARCDEAFFWIGWENANGCQIEKEVCERYKIPMILVEQKRT